MGRVSANERIGVYVRKTHWAHALIAQNTQLGAALDADDDVLLNRLIAAGASPNATNLDGQTLLAVAIADGRTRCRAVLEAAGANRGLPKRRKHADDSDGAGEPSKVKGSGLTNPPSTICGAAFSELKNNIATFNLHWKRAFNTGDTLCDDMSASAAEKSWMLACKQASTICLAASLPTTGDVAMCLTLLTPEVVLMRVLHICFGCWILRCWGRVSSDAELDGVAKVEHDRHDGDQPDPRLHPTGGGVVPS
jgi:hypothetical protein